MPPVVVFGCGNFGSSAAVSLDLGARRSVTPAALPRNDRSVSTAGSNRSTVEKRCDTQAMVPKNGWLVLIPAKKLASRLDRFGSISA